MSHESPWPPPIQTLHLAAGAQAVINGALITASEDCTIEVGAGAFVLTGRALWPRRDALRNPCDELYLSLIDCRGDEKRFEAERLRLFGLLSAVCAQDSGVENQRECARCVAALLEGDARAAVASAARLASNRIEAERLHPAPSHSGG
jgi:hypothetical protein